MVPIPNTSNEKAAFIKQHQIKKNIIFIIRSTAQPSANK